MLPNDFSEMEDFTSVIEFDTNSDNQKDWHEHDQAR